MKVKNIGLIIQGVLAGIFLFLFAYPYYMWEHQTIGHFLRLLYGVFLFFNYRKARDPFSIIWAILLVYLSFAIGNSIIATIVFVFANIFLLSVKDEFISITYKTLYNVFVIFTILSIINYALFYLGVSMPNHVIEPLNEAKLYDYTAYPFMVMANDVSGMLRFHGLFDEAGALATYCFLFLWAEGFRLFTWKNITLMIAGLLSLSLFFVLAMGIIMIIKFFSRGTSVWYRILSILIVALFAYSLTIEDSITSTAIGERLEYDEDKGFAGNNRSTSTLDAYYEKIRWKEPSFFLGPTLGGVDIKKVSSQTEGAAGYKRAILEVGLLGCVVYIVFFLIYANRNIKRRRDFLMFVLCLCMTLFQRPFFSDVVFIFMFVSIIKLHNDQYNEVVEGKLRKKVVHIPKEKPTEAGKTILNKKI